MSRSCGRTTACIRAISMTCSGWRLIGRCASVRPCGGTASNKPERAAMDRLIDTTELKRLFADGVNIMEHMRVAGETPANSATAILYSYDLQAGTYTQALDDPAYVAFKDRRAAVVADIVDPLGPATILD